LLLVATMSPLLSFPSILAVLTIFNLQPPPALASPVVACYVASWAVYRPGPGKFSVEDIDPTLCTHVIYTFAGLDNVTNHISVLDPNYDLTREGYRRAVALKRRNPALKVSVAIGGWTEGSAKYSAMAADPNSRKAFIDSVIAFLREHQFDGLDLDWEYPGKRGGRAEDKKNFVTLCQELRAVFAHTGWLLTAALGAGKATVDVAYDLPALSKELDYLHLMAYDYHGMWEEVTGHNAPLYPREDEGPAARTLNVEFSVEYYLKSGVPASKLVLGLPFYGRTYLLQDPANPSIGAPSVKDSAFAGDYTRENGFLGYNEICEKQIAEVGLWRLVWQKAHQAPFMSRDTMWVSYDDDNSLGLKVAYATQTQGLAGVMVWSVDTDDFRGNCGAGRYPLLRAINRAIGAGPAAAPEKPEVTHDVEGDNTIDGAFSSTHSGSGGKASSDASVLSSLQSFVLFAAFCLVVQYLFGHALPGSTGKVPKTYTPPPGEEESIPTSGDVDGGKKSKDD